MSKINLSSNVSGIGVFTLAAPNSNTDRTLTIPDQTGTMLSIAADGAVNNTNGAVSLGGGQVLKTAAGYFKASNTGTYQDQGGGNLAATANHVFDSTDDYGSLHYTRKTNGVAAILAGVRSSGGTGADLYVGVNAATGLVYRVLSNGNVQNTNNSYGAISDVKLKENVTDATPKLASLNQLRVVNYNLIGSELKQIGLIAQEVEQVFPGLVESTPDIDPETKEPTGTVTKAVKYSVLVPMLLKAVQELSAKVAALESKQ